MTFHTFADSTMIKLSSIDVVGPILSEEYFSGPVPDFLPPNSYAYRIVTLGFAGSAGSLGVNPLVRYSANLEELTAERNELVSLLLNQ